MAQIIAPGVCRYTINGLFVGRPVANIIDMQIDTTASVVSRADAVEAQAGILINEWSDHILPLVSNDYQANSVSWVDLNSSSGSVGARSTTSQETWPQTGAGAGATMPGNVALRVNKNIVASRGQRQGRMYLAGAGEGDNTDANPNAVAGAAQTAINDALESFLGNINQSDADPDAYVSRMVVIHTLDGEFTNYSEVNGLVVDPVLGSQRRRLRG